MEIIINVSSGKFVRPTIIGCALSAQSTDKSSVTFSEAEFSCNRLTIAITIKALRTTIAAMDKATSHLLPRLRDLVSVTGADTPFSSIGNVARIDFLLDDSVSFFGSCKSLSVASFILAIEYVVFHNAIIWFLRNSFENKTYWQYAIVVLERECRLPVNVTPRSTTFAPNNFPQITPPYIGGFLNNFIT